MRAQGKLRLAPVLSAAALVAGGTLVAVPPAQAAQGTPAQVTSSGGLSWIDCAEGVQCAYLTVPLDHRKPAGTTVQVALTKLPATGGKNQGTVVVNAGTQAGGGGAFVQGFPSAVAEINKNHDVIGLDTRGVGNSKPLVKCTTYEENFVIESALSASQTTADRPKRIQEARDIDAKCTERSADLLPHLSSTTSARDLEVLRKALGENQLRLVGVSGGALLAQNYLKLFPNRVAGVVLDSPFDADQYVNRAFDFDIDQMVSTERTIGTFFAWCAKNPKLCQFGDGDPRAAFEALLAKAEKNRLAEPANWGNVTGGSLIDFVSGGVIFPEQWSKMGTQLAEWSKQAKPTAPLNSGDDRTYSEYYSQACLDRTFPTSLTAFDHQLKRSLRSTSYLGGRYGYAQFKCWAWPVDAAERTTGPWVNPQHRPVLVLAGTDDPLAPNAGAVRTAQRQRAGLITVRGSGHIQLGKSSGADRKVAAFLASPTPDPSGGTFTVPLPTS